MAVLQLKPKIGEEAIRSNDEIEMALNDLMVQFRQMDKKYGLMVRKEINEMYLQNVDLISDSAAFLDNQNNHDRLS